MRVLIIFGLIASLSSCVSITDINYSSEKIENAWLLDYQRTEEAYRIRALDVNPDIAYQHTIKALNTIGLVVTKEDHAAGEVWAKGIAPSPLTNKEWEKIVVKENPRVKSLSNGILYLDKDPSDYTITVLVTLRRLKSSTLVILDYQLSSPKYEAYGIRLPKIAPPEAVLIGSLKFWDVLEQRLSQIDAPKPRLAKQHELGI
ncbi:MAG: hypothetical protein ACNI26_13030 [Terasakiella sp.]|uniref:hypothetical protein n=1 Tax=unclassified Terasakiella TaxID=2614952 RepID=UPI003AFF6B5E